MEVQQHGSPKGERSQILAREPDGHIEDLTRQAFACNDDLGAVLIVDVLRGVGAALGSSMLMASDPERYTVMDVRSLKSIPALGLLGPRWPEASESAWSEYLGACRSLSDTVGEPLRRVDRALFKADGKTAMP